MSDKRCSGCGEVKAVEAFSRNKSNKDGLQSRCKSCQRRHYEENREAILERNRRSYVKNREAELERGRRYHKENRDAVLDRQRRHYEENREAVLDRQRRYREENRAEVLESHRRYREENREAIREYNRLFGRKMRDMTRESATRSWERYTPAEDVHILASDEPDAVIAVELGRTLNSVKGRRYTLRKRTTHEAA